jgi:hypothetical protein
LVHVAPAKKSGSVKAAPQVNITPKEMAAEGGCRIGVWRAGGLDHPAGRDDAAFRPRGLSV